MLKIFAYIIYKRPPIILALLKTHIINATFKHKAPLTPNSQFASQDLVDFSINDLLKRVEEF